MLILVCLFLLSFSSFTIEARAQKKHAESKTESAVDTEPIQLATKQSPKEEVPEDCFLIDQSAIVIDGPEKRHVVCASDLDRASIYGKKLTIDEIITNELIFQDAIKFKIPIDSSVADKYIASVCKQNNMTPKDVDKIFINSGLTPEAGRNELIKMYGKNTMLEQKVMSRIFIPKHEVEEYCKQYPKYKEAKIELEIAYIPYDKDKSISEQKKEIEKSLRQSTLQITWRPPFKLKASDLAEDKMFISQMEAGQISKPQEAMGGFELFRVAAKKDRREVPIEKRYREVLEALREPKMGKIMDTYMKELKNEAAITYLS